MAPPKNWSWSLGSKLGTIRYTRREGLIHGKNGNGDFVRHKTFRMYHEIIMFCAAIFDGVINFHVLIMICAININQSTNHY